MSPSTKGTIEARIIDAGEGTLADFARLGGTVRGAILLIHSSEMKTFDDLFAEYMRNAVLNDAVRKHQPLAMLLESTRPRGLLYRHPISLDLNYGPVPTAIISREHAERLARLGGQGEDRLPPALRNKIGATHEAR